MLRKNGEPKLGKSIDEIFDTSELPPEIPGAKRKETPLQKAVHELKSTEVPGKSLDEMFDDEDTEESLRRDAFGGPGNDENEELELDPDVSSPDDEENKEAA